jgi:hypothetical protein
MPRVQAIAFAFLLTAPCLAAQVNPCGISPSTSDSASGVQFTIAIKADRASFQEGEIIPLSLSFASTEKNRYKVEDLNYDYSGRLHTELYCVEPDASDPLESYYAAQGDLTGGPGGRRTLSTIPFTTEADLNEYRTLAPGHYRLYAFSFRIWRLSDQDQKSPFGEHLEGVRSNTLELEVKPASAQWQSEQLQSALRSLKGPSPTEELQHAARRLRFLNTRGSTKELAHLFVGSESDDLPATEFVFGLYGSPYRQLAIDSMHKEIAAPGHAISEEFLGNLVELQITSDPSWNRPSQSNDPEAIRAVDAYRRRRQVHQQEILKALAQELLAAFPKKVGRARALSAVGVLMSESEDAEFIQAVRPTLIAAWNDLPEHNQQTLVESHWRLIAGPDMLPILIRMVSGPPPEAGTYAATVRDAALQHIFQLDPVAARPLIRRELQKSGTEPSLELLKLLPAEDIAPVIQPSLDRIAKNQARTHDFERLEQFADDAALAPMKAAFEGNFGKLGCNQQTSMLRYFLRVSPQYGAAQVAASLQKTGKVNCHGSILFSLEEQLPHAEQVAIQALDEQDAFVIRDAATALSRWGSSAAEAPLWARLERFHQKWAGHQAEFTQTSPLNPDGEDNQVERDLIAAIAEGTNWLCTPDKLARLKELAVSDAQREQIETWINDWNTGPPTIVPQWGDEQFVEFSVLASSGLTEEQLKTKLAQFPRGTRILWELWQPALIDPSVGMKRQEAEYETFRTLAEKKDITLVKEVLP